MALILDTNAFSDFADGNASVRQCIAGERDLLVPVIVLGEYLFGIRQSRHRKRYEAWIEAEMSKFLVLPVSAETAEHYAEIREELKVGGRPIPANDVWIAALARQFKCRILTQDRHFERVSRISLLTW